jgi:oligoendopeptidase F
MQNITKWNLSPLFQNENDPQIEKAREKSVKQAGIFIKKWKSNDNFLNAPSVLKEALDDYEKFWKSTGDNAKEVYYFNLLSSLDEADPKLKAAENIATQTALKIRNDLQFFELGLSKIDGKMQKLFLNSKLLANYKHYLERLFATAKHLLSEPEEKIMNLKSVPSYSNWVKMTSSFLSKEEKEILTEKGNKETKNFSQILSAIDSKNKKVRNSAAKALNKIFEKHLDVAENELNSVLFDKKINDELRGYERPESARHLADDIDTKVVNSLLKSVSANFSIAKRYYSLKAKLMKVPILAYHERNVEYGKTDKKYDYDKTIGVVSKVTKELDPKFYEIFNKFINEGSVDVFPKKGKRSGAFCTHSLITHPTYILLNHTDKIDDLRTFAHELGHGINNELIKEKQNALNFGTPTSTAEVASTFFEDFVFQEIIKDADEEYRLSLMVSKLNQDISTIFRQIAFYNFEVDLHKDFREKGYLSKEDIGKLFRKHMMSYMGPAIEQSEGSQNWWVYVQHFRYFFYVYSYAGGLLISKSLQAQVRKDPKFIEKVKIFLSAGLSDSPKNIFKKLKIDITDQKFWDRGIGEVDNLLKETEILAKKLKTV